MSMTKEHAEKLKDRPAVVCCRTTKGTVIGPAELEDPEIFPDLEDSGLITLSDDVLCIGDVLGATLTQDIDGLTPLTADLLEGVQPKAAPAPQEPAGPNASAAVASPAAPMAAAPLGQSCGGFIHIKADQVTNLDLTIPLGVYGATLPAVETQAPAVALGQAEGPSASMPAVEDIVYGTLEKRFFSVKDVVIGKETSFKDGVLSIRQDSGKDAMSLLPLIKKLTIDVIPADKRHVHTETIMDVIPVAAKVDGEVGSGTTNVLNDVVFILTGIDEDGTQIHEFGSSDGFLDETVIFGRPGCPDEHDIIVRVHVVLERLTGMERRGPMAAHAACDHIIQEVRSVIRHLDPQDAASVETYENVKRKGRPRVLLVKEIMGQGAMHDNVILPSEPAGVPGGRPNVDIGNVPVVLSPNEVRDGGIHALCCIGPASKEMTRHYFREPLLARLADDTELDLVGVVFVGSPQVNDEKTFVSKRLGAMAETMDIDGAIVTTEGFGNNHIDFASHIEQLGMRGIKTVGVTYSAYQGQLVVGNEYMDAIVELNKDKEGFESEKLGENTLIDADARRAVLMLKNKLAGVEIAAPETKWNAQVPVNNQKIVDANNQ